VVVALLALLTPALGSLPQLPAAGVALAGTVAAGQCTPQLPGHTVVAGTSWWTAAGAAGAGMHGAPQVPVTVRGLPPLGVPALAWGLGAVAVVVVVVGTTPPRQLQGPPAPTPPPQARPPPPLATGGLGRPGAAWGAVAPMVPRRPCRRPLSRGTGPHPRTPPPPTAGPPLGPGRRGPAPTRPQGVQAPVAPPAWAPPRLGQGTAPPPTGTQPCRVRAPPRMGVWVAGQVGAVWVGLGLVGPGLVEGRL
jgi:hypothetical protein